MLPDIGKNILAVLERAQIIGHSPDNCPGDEFFFGRIPWKNNADEVRSMGRKRVLAVLRPYRGA